MVRTRGQRAADTSDDEAPEEVVNVMAQEEGAKQRRAAREAAASAKKSKAQRQQPSASKAAAQAAEAGPSSAHEGESDGGGDEDMLPEDLLRQLAERRRSGVGAASLAQTHKHPQQHGVNKLVKPRHRLTEVRKGPVTVKVLKAATGPAFASGAALSFREQQLGGARVRRDIGMLSEAGSRHSRPAAKFA